MRDYKKNFMFAFVTILAILVISVSAIQFEKSQKNKIHSNLEKIYNSAITLERTNMNLHEDSDGKGKYIDLSSSVGLDVYNKKKKKSYSLYKDYHNLEKIVVFYDDGSLYSYPPKEKEIPEEYGEELYSFREDGDSITIFGFSSRGLSKLSSEDIIEIPEEINGKRVERIAPRAFKSMNITGGVFIPDSVKEIGVDAFSGNGTKKLTENIRGTGLWIPSERQWVKKES